MSIKNSNISHMDDMVERDSWMDKTECLLCPICKNKTRNRIREDTELKNYPLYCPKCKQETLINAKDLQITVVQKREH